MARALLGKLLIRDLQGERLTSRITEVEAYLGLIDPASHAARGLTPSNAILFGPSGHVYVYFIYGMYYCLNVASHLPGETGGVLIRALDPIDGLETMADLRGLPHNAKPKLLTGGPGRLCQALDITRSNSNGLDVTSPTSAIRIADDGHHPTEIQTTPRIGISKAADRPSASSSAKSPKPDAPHLTREMWSPPHTSSDLSLFTRRFCARKFFRRGYPRI